MEQNILTPSAIWKDFSAEGDLKPSIIREDVEDGILFREVYFNGRATGDGVVRIYAMFAAPAGGVHPAILYCHNFGSGWERENLRVICQNGYAALSFDYTGEREGVSRYTIYPKSIDYANYMRAGRHLLYADTNAKETSLYEWSCVAKYAAKYLSGLPEVDPNAIAALGVREGGYLAWQLASFCPQISAACSMFEAGWTECAGRFKYGGEPEAQPLNEERQRWLAGLATQVYAPHVKVPFLYMGATNDALGCMDRVADTLARVEPDNYAVFSERLSNMLYDKCFQTLTAFLARYLGLSDQPFPEKPQAVFFVGEGRLFLRMQTDPATPVEEAALFYALAEPDPTVRNWCACEGLSQSGSSFTGEISDYDGDKLVFGYGAVKYRGGVYLTTNLLAVRPGDIGAEARQIKREQMLYNAEMGRDSFTVLDLKGGRQDANLFVPDVPVEVESGAYGIKGIAAKKYQLATFKLHDPRYRGGDNTLKFDAYSPVAAELTVTAIEDFAKSGERRYAATIPLVGGELWQKAELAPSALKTAEGLPLRSWEAAEAVCFDSPAKFLLSNMLWL